MRLILVLIMVCCFAGVFWTIWAWLTNYRPIARLVPILLLCAVGLFIMVRILYFPGA